MKGTYSNIYTVLLLLSSLLFSCKHEDLTVPKPNKDIRPAGDFIRNNYDFSLFYAALEYTGLVAELNGKGPFTVLAPTDQAFHELGVQLPGDFQKMNKDSLRFVMAYHILPIRLLSSDIPVNGVDIRYQTLAGKQLYASLGMFSPGYNYPQNFFTFGGCQLDRRDITLSNGVMHTMKKLQKPFPDVTVQAWLAARPAYSIYVAGLKKFGLWDALARPGRFTIFAPNNQAFADAGITMEDIAALNPALYEGARLFGAYILYDRQYFITDKIVFGIINAESRYKYRVKDDDCDFELTAYFQEYTVSLSHVPGGNSQPEVFGSVTVPSTEWVKMDNICENGIVHQLPGLMVRLDQAKK
ncbi:fasciclin domain-containing protein [Chitinophaga arvensicola]|uniref:Uncaracterized surface protein containing fasciclin (FAS1) repeats n=1 Tax=Chitinophaga arvensicola TaxID=29529 RepID=A0A1I0S782_9BACT|nr:fasciclin domain-containing protein [Chitinophaga arvensicola]SEW51610.1 Uncaracterized surface protein containing fasciclin (FAS1) repeats [Chitinophaga arvensicola]